MTRKDYVAIAKALKDTLAECQASEFKIGVKTSAYRLADVLASDNARFDRARFLQACGVQS